MVANNIHSITKNRDRNLVVIFNTNTSLPQIINVLDNSVGQEQRRMWRNFQNYLSQNRENGVSRRDLEENIQKIKKNTSQETKNPKGLGKGAIASLIIGGVVVVGLLGVLLVRKNKKIKK